MKPHGAINEAFNKNKRVFIITTVIINFTHYHSFIISINIIISVNSKPHSAINIALLRLLVIISKGYILIIMRFSAFHYNNYYNYQYT